MAEGIRETAKEKQLRDDLDWLEEIVTKPNEEISRERRIQTFNRVALLARQALAHEETLRHIATLHCGIDFTKEPGVTLDMVPAFVEGQIDKQSERADKAELKAARLEEQLEIINANLAGIEERLNNIKAQRTPGD